MKLNSVQIQETLHQIDAKPVPPDHPLIPQLERMYGEHTYFLDDNGLSIVEPTASDWTDSQLGLVVNLANWTDANTPELAPHEPEATDLFVRLGTTLPQ